MNPTIACVFHHTTPLGTDPEHLVAVLQRFVLEHFGPVWGVSARVYHAGAPAAGEWPLYFLDDADQAGALGYHDDPAGPAGPRGFVFVHTSQLHNDPVSVVASHEVAELLADPGCNLGALSPRGRWVALEPCDPVESETFDVDGLPVSDFAYPAWFGAPGGIRYDHLWRCNQPWQILPGGYLPVWSAGRWTQLFGSGEAVARHQPRDKRFRRTERRKLKHLPPHALPAAGQEDGQGCGIGRASFSGALVGLG